VKTSNFKDKSKKITLMKHFKLYLLILLVLIGCHKAAENIPVGMEKSSTESLSAPSPGMANEKSFRSDAGSEYGEEPVPERQIIKTGWMRVEIKDYSGDLAKIKSIIAKHQGYISGENESSTEYSLINSLTIRVPSTEFDSLVQDITKVAHKVDNKTINLNDVTEEFIDIEARLKTKKEVEQRYMEILKKAQTVQDILLVEQQLRMIQEEIEAKEGRLKYLQNQVSLSTLSLEIHQDFAAQPGFKFFGKLGEALKGGWKGFLNVIVGLIYIWPLILVAGGTLFWIFKRRRKKRSEK
jgi:Domain of unknown function (DUF4349)